MMDEDERWKMYGWFDLFNHWGICIQVRQILNQIVS
jgi:hypothetical protein